MPTQNINTSLQNHYLAPFSYSYVTYALAILIVNMYIYTLHAIHVYFIANLSKCLNFNTTKMNSWSSNKSKYYSTTTNTSVLHVFLFTISFFIIVYHTYQLCTIIEIKLSSRVFIKLITLKAFPTISLIKLTDPILLNV